MPIYNLTYHKRALSLLKLIAMLLYILPAAVYAQDVLVDDMPMNGWHDRTTYQALWDSLTVAGGNIEFTTDSGRYPELEEYEMLILMHHGTFGPTGFSSSQRSQIIDFVCHGGNVLVMPIRDGTPHNQLLNDPRWNTGLYYSGTGGFVHSTNIADYPPYTDGIEYLHFEYTAIILASLPAHAFAWDESGAQILAAISYPTSDSIDCPCENGGRILAIADNHTLEAPVVGYIEPMDHRFIVNIMLAMSGLGDTLNPCDPAPGEPVAEIDTCLYPGDIYTIYGENLYSPMTLSIGGVSVTPSFGADSTSMTFETPAMPQGFYSVQIEYSGAVYLIGIIEIYCEWIRISAVGMGCYEIGDTIEFSGENFSMSAVSIELITPDNNDTIIVTDYAITSPETGWLVIPEEIDTVTYSYQFIRIINDIGNWDVFFVQIPCPCPGQEEEYNVGAGDSRPGDSRNPNVTAVPLDSCFLLSVEGGYIYYDTSIDSFMSVPGYWPGRNPTHPIDIQYSTDSGVSWVYLARNLANTGSFFWAPPDTGNEFQFIVTATDSFGNSGSDTIVVCVEDFDEPPLTGILWGYFGCEPDSFIFIIRDSSIVDMMTLIVEFDTFRFHFPDSLRWMNDTTLVFYPPLPYGDSTMHWMRMSEGLSTTSGVRIVPDTSHGLSLVFPTDFTPPTIRQVFPSPDTVLDSIPVEATVVITDWIGVDDTTIWVSINDESFYMPYTGLSYTDTVLKIDFIALADSEDTVFTVCIGASDRDYPVECVSSSELCYTFRLALPPIIDPVLPSDSIITSCERMQIKFYITDDTTIDWSTLRLDIGAETGILDSDFRISHSGDTLIFIPDDDWLSCETVYTAITALEDIDGVSAEGLPAGAYFMLDLQPPTFWGISPIGEVLEDSPIITINIDDTCTGVDPDSIWLKFDGAFYDLDSAGMWWSFGVLEFNLIDAGISLTPFDTILICVHAADFAEECGANADSVCWDIYMYELICSLEVDVTVDDDSICFGDTTQLHALAHGGYGSVSYNWSPGSGLDDPTSQNPIVVIDSTGTFTVTAIDDSGCIATDSAIIVVLPLPVIDLPDTTVCFDSPFILHAGTGYDTYLWNTGATEESLDVIASYDSMLYWVDVTEAGCTVRDSFWVFTIPLPVVDIIDTSICWGNSVVIKADSVYDEYLWSTGSIDDSIIVIADFDSMLYWFEVTEDGCISQDTFRIFSIPLPVIDIPDTAVCRGSALTIRTDTIFDDYLWSDGSTGDSLDIIADFDSLLYWLEVAEDGCISQDTFWIFTIPLPVIEIPDTTVCLDSTVVIHAGDGYDSYLWSTLAIEDSIVVVASYDSMLYWVEVSESGCFACDSLRVFTEDCSIPCTLDIVVCPDTTICEGDTAYLWVDAGTYNGFVTYLWTPTANLDNANSPTPVATPMTTTIYTVIVTHSFDCTDTGTVTVIVIPNPDISISDTTVCIDSTVVIHAGDGYDSYLWNTSAIEESIVVVASYDSMLYRVEVSENGCFAHDSLWIFTQVCDTFVCMLGVSAYTDADSLCEGDITRLHAIITGAVEPFNTEWSPDMYLSDATTLEPFAFPVSDITYTILAVDDSGCVAEDSVFIRVVSCDDETCFIHPKPFTPDGDGINEFGKFEYPGMSENEGIVYIYTLENEFVREIKNGDIKQSVDGTIFWDGKDSGGRLMENGPYLYIIRVHGETVCRGTVYIAR